MRKGEAKLTAIMLLNMGEAKFTAIHVALRHLIKYS